MSIQQYELNSGLRVISDHIPSANTTSVNFVVNVGGLDEADTEAGLSHLIEHTVHQATRRFKGNQARLNYEEDCLYASDAKTGLESTQYHGRGIYAHKIIEGLGSLVLEPTLSDETVNHEIEVVTREAKMNIDNIGALWFFAGLQTTVAAPYSRPVIGYADALDFNPERVREFYRKFYTPRDIAVITAGKLSVETVAGHLRELWPALDEPATSDVLPPRQRRPAPEIKPAGNFWFPNQARQANTYIASGVILNEDTALEMSRRHNYAYVIASQLMSSNISKELRENLRLSYDGGFWYSSDWHPRFWTLAAGVTVEPDKVEIAQEAIDRTIATNQTIRDETILRKIKSNIGGIHIKCDDLEWRAGAIINPVVYQTDIIGHERLTQFYERVTVQAVREALDDLSRQFLKNPRYTRYDAAEPPTDDCKEIQPKLTLH